MRNEFSPFFIFSKRKRAARVTFFSFLHLLLPFLLSKPSSTTTSDRDGLVTLDELAAFGAAASRVAASSSSQGGTFRDAVRGAAALSAAEELSGAACGKRGKGKGREATRSPSLCPRCDDDREELSHAAREAAADWLIRLVVADDAVRSAVRGEARRRPDENKGNDADGGGESKPTCSSSAPLVHSASLRALVELLAPFDDDVGGCAGGGCSYNHYHDPRPQRRGRMRGREREKAAPTVRPVLSSSSSSGEAAEEEKEEEEEEQEKKERRRRERENDDDRAFAAIFASLKAAARAPASSSSSPRDEKPSSSRNTAAAAAGDEAGDHDETDGDPEDWVPVSAVRHLGKGAVDGVARLLGRVCGSGNDVGDGENEAFGGGRKRELAAAAAGGGGTGEEGTVVRRLWDAAGAHGV